MQKYIFSFLILIICGCSIQGTEKTKDHQAISTFRVFPALHGFDIFYDSGATKTIKEYYISGSIVFNGSYFGVTEFGAYFPAGLWESDTMTCCGLYLNNPYGTGIGISTAPNYDDPNLGYIVGISRTGSVQIFPRKELKRNAGPYKNTFQAGPLILSGNILQDFGDSWHANELHERTLIGVTRSGKTYFFISTEKISLTDIGKKILEQAIFKDDPITVVNLDGGPSTAYYDGVRGFRKKAKLPIIFRIKP